MLRELLKTEMGNLALEKKLSSLEKPKSFVIHEELMTETNDCLTPTFKVKRNMVQKKY